MIKLKDILLEKFEIDVEIGDTILRGKFKNKPVIVKDFGVDDKGQPTINGKKMLSFRIKKLMPKYKDVKMTEAGCKLMDILAEGVYDPGIFKAVFTAGGPGSGKSYAASTLFGMPEKMPFVSAQGLKGVNTDKAFEVLLKKAGLGTDIQSMGPDKYAQAMKIRKKAKSVMVAAMKNYIDGKLGMIIDGTGHNAGKINKKKKSLEKLGYDTFMVFVNTSLKVALDRNAKRERKVPEDIVKEYWNDCQQNLGKFQSMFGASNMLIVDNSKYQAFAKEVTKAANKFVSKPVQNPVAKAWIKKELELRKYK